VPPAAQRRLALQHPDGVTERVAQALLGLSRHLATVRHRGGAGIAPRTGSTAAQSAGMQDRGARSTRRRALVRATTLVLALVAVAMAGALALRSLDDLARTGRTTERFDPPVWAGQNVPGACSGGFYVRQGEAIALTIVAHCANPGDTLRDDRGRTIGVFGPRAQLDDYPPERFCAPSDFLALVLEDESIPWGHLNLVDMGAGGYRTIPVGTRPLACGDIHVGDRVEVDGRELYRAGTVTAVGAYAFETDTIFPCMVTTDISVGVGDSGGAVLVNGLPAGVISREIGGRLGFTPLAEGLESLGLTLCTTPNCD
jgi:hypothetical protein